MKKNDITDTEFIRRHDEILDKYKDDPQSLNYKVSVHDSTIKKTDSYTTLEKLIEKIITIKNKINREGLSTPIPPDPVEIPDKTTIAPQSEHPSSSKNFESGASKANGISIGDLENENKDILKLLAKEKSDRSKEASEAAKRISSLEVENRRLIKENEKVKGLEKEKNFLTNMLLRPSKSFATSIRLLSEEKFDLNIKAGSQEIAFLGIPKGNFIYGITEKEYEELLKLTRDIQFDNEITYNQNHTIRDYFLIGKYEVTNEQYQAIIKSHSYDSKDAKKPVVNLSYEDVQKFCSKLNNQHPDLIIDIPTEQEWEYAARGVDGKIYPWGNSFPSGYSTPAANITGAKLQDVGRYGDGKSLFSGAFDMIGNAYEMCKIDKTSYTFKSTTEQVTARGGSFKTKKTNSRTTSRYTLFGKRKRDDLGFRLVIRSKKLTP